MVKERKASNTLFPNFARELELHPGGYHRTYGRVDLAQAMDWFTQHQSGRSNSERCQRGKSRLASRATIAKDPRTGNTILATKDGNEADRTMTSKSFSAVVLESVHQHLDNLGFKKRKQGIASRVISDDVLAIVGLNTAKGRGPGVLEVNPVVGLRNQRVERLVSDLDDSVFDELNPFTAGANVGYLSPASRYLPFLFHDGQPIETVSLQLVQAVRDYGLPFVEANVDLATLLTTLHSPRRSIQFQSAYRIPVVLHLLGREAEAEAFLDGELAKLNAAADPTVERLTRFSVRFREMSQPQKNVVGTQ